MDKRRNFFEQLQPPTDKFLNKLQNSYITDYIPSKVSINKEIKYTEDNIIDIVGKNIFLIRNLANIQDYQKLVDEIEKSEYEKKKNLDKLVNKDIEKLENDNVNLLK